MSLLSIETFHFPARATISDSFLNILFIILLFSKWNAREGEGGGAEVRGKEAEINLSSATLPKHLLNHG
jgi:hypothetical protein